MSTENVIYLMVRVRYSTPWYRHWVGQVALGFPVHDLGHDRVFFKVAPIIAHDMVQRGVPTADLVDVQVTRLAPTDQKYIDRYLTDGTTEVEPGLWMYWAESKEPFRNGFGMVTD